MFVELHVIQNYPPSCLNRDDTNTPKTTLFGGYRRPRISSQCLKRAIRLHPGFLEALSGKVGTRTRMVPLKVMQVLMDRCPRDGMPMDKVLPIVEQVLNMAGFNLKEGKTQVLLFLSQAEIAQLCLLVDRHFDELLELAEEARVEKEEKEKKAALEAEKEEKGAPVKKKVKAKKTKGKAEEGLSKELTAKIKAVSNKIKNSPDFRKDISQAADIALFGRMMSERQGMGVDSSCQVEHSYATHLSENESDFYTAIDDLHGGGTGAGMMGSVDFNSACFYRYSVVDTCQLMENLSQDRILALDTIMAYIQAAIEARPSGKQNSMAAHSRPSFIKIRVRESGMPTSLCNAFEKPVSPGTEGLVQESIRALLEHDADLQGFYGSEGIVLDVDGRVGGETSLSALLQQLRGVLEVSLS